MAPPNPLTKIINPINPLLPASKTKQDMTLQIAIMSALKYANVAAPVLGALVAEILSVAAGLGH